MNIASTQANPVAAEPTQSVANKRAGLQLALLRKALDAQQQTMEQLTNASEGKGQNLDIRV